MFILQSMLVSLPIVVNINTIQDESNWCLTLLSTIFQILFYMNYVIKKNIMAFYTPVLRRAVLCDWVWRAGGRASTQVSAQ